MTHYERIRLFRDYLYNRLDEDFSGDVAAFARALDENTGIFSLKVIAQFHKRVQDLEGDYDVLLNTLDEFEPALLKMDDRVVLQSEFDLDNPCEPVISFQLDFVNFQDDTHQG